MSWPSRNSISSVRVKPSCMIAAPESCVSTIARIDRRADIGDVDELRHPHCAGLGVDLDLGAGAADHPEGRRVGGEAGFVIGRGIARDEAADADDVAGLHAVFAAEELGDRADCCLAAGRARLRAPRVLSRASSAARSHRVAHVKGRARAERRHVVGRDIGVGMDDPDRLRGAGRAPRRRSAPSPCRSPGPYRRCCNRGRSCRRRRC